MKTLDSVIKQYRKRIELHLTSTSSTGISYDKEGNKYWRGMKLVDGLRWSYARKLKKWEETLRFMPEYFERNPIHTGVHLKDNPELTDMFEKWLHHYYDYLVFIEDKTEEDIWKHISG